MKLTIDDPRLTAYALGELDAAEHADIARELAQSPELQAEVEAIRRTGEQLNRELASEQSCLRCHDAGTPIKGHKTYDVHSERCQY